MPLSYHYKLIHADFKDLVESFSWTSRETKLSILTGITATAAIFFATAIQLPLPLWSALSVVLVMKSTVGGAFDKGWMRFCGALLGCILSVYLFSFTAQNPIAFSICTVIGIILSFYLGTEAKYGYFFSYLFANMVLLTFVDFGSPYNNFPIQIAYYRALEIFIGVSFGFISSIILFPVFASDTIEKKLTLMIKEYISSNIELLKQYQGKYKDIEILKKHIVQLSINLNSLKNLFAMYKHEQSLSFSSTTDYQSVIKLIEERITTFNILVNFFTLTDPDNSNSDSQFISSAIAHLEKAKNIKDYKSNRFKKQLKFQIDSFENYLNKIDLTNFKEKNGITSSYFIYLVKHIQNSTTALYSINVNKFEKEVVTSKKKSGLLFDGDYIFIGKNFFSLKLYKPSLMNAVKGAFAVLAIFWINLWIRVPDGYINMTVAIFTILGPNMNVINTKHKGILRALGCSLGAAIGLFYVSFAVTTTWIHFLVILIVLTLFSIIANAKDGISYLGIQASIAFLICTCFGFGPTNTIEDVFERLFGILLAIGIIWIINSILFPEDFKQKLIRKITVTKRILLEYISESFTNSTEMEPFNILDIRKNLLSKMDELTKICEYMDDIPQSEVQRTRVWNKEIKNITLYLHRLNNMSNTVINEYKNKYPKIKDHIKKLLILSVSSKRQTNIKGKKLLSLISIFEEEIMKTPLPEKSYNRIINKEVKEINTAEFSVIFYTLSILESCKILISENINSRLEENYQKENTNYVRKKLQPESITS